MAPPSPDTMLLPCTGDAVSAVEEHVAEARRMLQRQKGLIVRLPQAYPHWMRREYFGCWTDVGMYYIKLSPENRSPR